MARVVDKLLACQTKIEQITGQALSDLKSTVGFVCMLRSESVKACFYDDQNVCYDRSRGVVWSHKAPE